MGMLKKNGKYGKYLKEVAKPGGLRAVKQRSVISQSDKKETIRSMSHNRLSVKS